MPTAAIMTVGCRLNQAESGKLAGELAAAGYTLVEWGQPADLLILNSCSVTGAAARKSRYALRHVRRQCPSAFIVVTGCDVDVEPETWRDIDAGCDWVVPNPGKAALVASLPKPLPTHAPGSLPAWSPPLSGPQSKRFQEPLQRHSPGHTRAHLKIQDGCDFFCSYCIIPSTRGAPRSREWDNVLAEAESLITAGVKEIVLSGVNIMLYEADGRTLSDLIQAILDLPGSFRIRLGSTEPGAELARLLPLMAGNRRLCRFLHLPLQHGDDGILRAMRRRYASQEYLSYAEAACRAIPGLCIGTDIIVGFPGETAASFSASAELLQKLPLAYIHLFPFSPRPGTIAATLPNRVPLRLTREREKQLRVLNAAKATAFARAQVGQQLEILTETCNRQGNWEGWSDNYQRVEVLNSPADGGANRLLRVQVEAMTEECRLQGHWCGGSGHTDPQDPPCSRAMESTLRL